METLIIPAIIFGLPLAFVTVLYVIGAVISKWTGERWL